MENAVEHVTERTTLLVQGLASNDKEILDKILQNEDRSFILRTVHQVPMDYIVPMIEEIGRRIRKGGTKTLCYLSWLRIIINKNMTFLQSHPKKSSVLEPLLLCFKHDTVLLQSLLCLKGRLDLLFSQIQDTTEEELTQSRAKHYYDESDDDIFESEDEMADQSANKEKNWEEYSGEDYDDDEMEYEDGDGEDDLEEQGEEIDGQDGGDQDDEEGSDDDSDDEEGEGSDDELDDLDAGDL